MSEQPDLLEVAIPLQPQSAGPAPPGLASTGHGFFFNLLMDAARPIAEALHASSTKQGQHRQPFTVSPLLDAPNGTPVHWVSPDRWYWLRLTLLTAPLVELWHQRLAPALPSQLYLGAAQEQRACWTFTRSAGMPPVHERAAHYRDLLAGPPARRWRLRFVTPMTFQMSLAPDERKRLPPLFFPLPAPEPLFRNLASAWSVWAPPSCAEEVDAERVLTLARQIQIEEAQLQVATWPPPLEFAETRKAASQTDWHNGPRAACTGEAVLVYYPARPWNPEADLEQCRLLRALLSFATFGGIGVQTARGMGIVHAIPIGPPVRATQYTQRGN